jgi:phosphoribosylanthranilate isomerase
MPRRHWLAYEDAEMTKVKICGITNLNDALLSVGCGAVALGFNFYEKSPRYISPESAREIGSRLPNNVDKVGVFVNETIPRMFEVVATADLDAIQLHGEESPEFVQQLRSHTGCRIIKVLRASPGFDPEEILKYNADAILLDAYSPTDIGGTGKTVDRTLAKTCAAMVSKFYLAGGLSIDNVAEAIRIVRPFAVDACSRLESEPGKKDPVKVERFIAAVRETI